MTRISWKYGDQSIVFWHNMFLQGLTYKKQNRVPSLSITDLHSIAWRLIFWFHEGRRDMQDTGWWVNLQSRYFRKSINNGPCIFPNWIDLILLWKHWFCTRHVKCSQSALFVKEIRTNLKTRLESLHLFNCRNTKQICYVQIENLQDVDKCADKNSCRLGKQERFHSRDIYSHLRTWTEQQIYRQISSNLLFKICMYRFHFVN